MKKILVTGGAGFIGTHLVERLARRGKLLLLDSFRRDALSLAPQLRDLTNVSIVVADINSAEAIVGLCDGVDSIVHLAAVAGVSSYYNEALATLRTNILGTVNLLDHAVRAGIAKFIYFSTSEVYGSRARNVSEADAVVIESVKDRRWVYSTSKIAGENFALRYAEEYGFSCTVVRPFNIYGPRQVGEGAISNFCRAAVAGTPMRVYGDGSELRAWCYVSDLVDAVEAILDSPAAGGQVFNIGNPDAIETSLGLARRLQRLSPGARIVNEDPGHSSVKERWPDIGAARDILKFEPKIGLREGLRRTLDWFRNIHASRECR